MTAHNYPKHLTNVSSKNSLHLNHCTTNDTYLSTAVGREQGLIVKLSWRCLSTPTTLASLGQVEVCLQRKIKGPDTPACGRAVCLAQQRWRRFPTGTKNAQVSENGCTTLQRRKRTHTQTRINRSFIHVVGSLQVSLQYSRSSLSRDPHSCYATTNVSLSRRSSSLSGSLVRVSPTWRPCRVNGLFALPTK